MKLNCEAGDLARIVRPYLIAEMVGLYVSVVRAGADYETVFTRQGEMCENDGPGGVGWLCDAHAPGFPCFIGDEFLRPIRDPGDDAQDETLSWLPVPTVEGVPA